MIHNTIGFDCVSFEIEYNKYHKIKPNISKLGYIYWCDGNCGYYIVSESLMVNKGCQIFDHSLITDICEPTREEILYLELLYGSKTVETYKHMLEVYSNIKNGGTRIERI